MLAHAGKRQGGGDEGVRLLLKNAVLPERNVLVLQRDAGGVANPAIRALEVAPDEVDGGGIFLGLESLDPMTQRAGLAGSLQIIQFGGGGSGLGRLRAGVGHAVEA